MKKYLPLIAVAFILIISLVIFLRKSSQNNLTVDNSIPDLPINSLPIAERPYITLSPDATGRSLNLFVNGTPTTGDLEYELIYQASEKQEGAIGTLYLDTEKQPIIKSILLGSKSGGGKVTYHEGVTGGSFTVTYGQTRLKESWNFLKFDPADPTLGSSDGRFSVTVSKTALKKDQMIVTMKSFGYPQANLPAETLVKAGPYFYATQVALKGNVSVSIKLPAGEHVNPALYGYDGKVWSKLPAKLDGGTLTSASVAPTISTFLATSE